MRRLGSSAEGLNPGEAERRLRELGLNVIVEGGGRGLGSLLLGQLKNPFIPVLLLATAISALVESAVDAILISAVVMAIVISGALIERSSERTLRALRKMASPIVKVRRAGDGGKIDSTLLVPGDVVVLEGGDVAPADIRLLESNMLRVDESSLTGEPIPVSKDASAILQPDTPVYKRVNMVLAGTRMISGSAVGVIVETGSRTELGKIATLTAESEERTPLERRVSKLSTHMSLLFLAVIVVYAGYSSMLGSPLLDVILLAAALAVAAVPEGLPAVIVMMLALGARRMALKNALIRRLSAVEGLGSCNVVCADKTGTLTENKLIVAELALTGSDASAYALVATICNDAPSNEDPVDLALLEHVKSLGFDVEGLRSRYPRISVEPFDPERRYMSVVVDVEGRPMKLVKGAPELIMERAALVLEDDGRRSLDPEGRAAWIDRAEGMGLRGLKPLALALDDGRGLTLIGLVGLEDRPREGAAEAVSALRAAGVKVAMITGDSGPTARAVAEGLGIDSNLRSLSGTDVDEMHVETLSKIMGEVGVFYRTTPAQKLKIVEAYKRSGFFVAMTGDGVNDAPALKSAHIGVAMGLRGTEVAKEAADMVLLDDNITTLKAAVEEGRGIFNNIRKAASILLSANLMEVVVLSAAGFLGMPPPLTALHLLWVNVVTDVVPLLPLAMDPPSPHLLRRPPMDPKESLVPAKLWTMLTIIAFLLSAIALYSHFMIFQISLTLSRSIVLNMIVIVELALVAFFRLLYDRGWSPNRMLYFALMAALAMQIAITEIPQLALLFGITPLGIHGWTMAAAPAAFVMAAGVLVHRIVLKHDDMKAG